MKILQVIATLSAGGAEGFITNLSAEMARQGEDVRFFLLGGVRGERGEVLLSRLREAGVVVEGVEDRKASSVRNLLRLARRIRNWSPDIVQASLQSGEVACLAARLLACDTRGRYVRRLANPRHNTDALTRHLFLARGRAFHMTIACSDAVALATREAARGVGIGALETIVNGGHLLESLPTPSERHAARAELGVSRSSYVVGHIGGFRRDLSSAGGLAYGAKAHDVIIKAFSLAFHRDRDAVLLLAGEGELRAEAELLAARLQVEGQVRFVGTVAEPWLVLKAADVFFFPSRSEGMPNVLPEAASCGLPVVASDIPQIRSLCSGADWVLRPVDDVDSFAAALRYVRARKDRYASNAAAAAEKFRQRFSMQMCAESYLDLYRRVVHP